MALTHKGDVFVISNPLRDVFDPFNSIGDALRVFVFFTQLRVFLPFLDEFVSFYLHFLPYGYPLGIFGIFLKLNYT